MNIWVDISQEEWRSVEQELPDIAPILQHIENQPRQDEVIVRPLNPEVIRLLRISSSCFWDAIHNLWGAWFALKQALGITKYPKCVRIAYSANVEITEANEFAIDFLNHFYADYVPLLLFSSVEHALKGLAILHGIEISKESENGESKGKKKRKKKNLLEKTIKAYESQYPNHPFISHLKILHSSKACREVFGYRNDWVHEKKIHVETIRYNPRRKDYIEYIGSNPVILSRVKQTHDKSWSWNEFLERLRTALAETMSFLDDCLDQWGNEYNNHQKS
jgi:hypothetical protein